MAGQLFKLSIPSPCTEDWNAMTPTGDGRHCRHCNKVVTDFSVLSDEAIQQYVFQNQGKEMCGRFRHSQLERITIYIPSYIFQKRLPLWKKYLVVLLICFGQDILPADIVWGSSQELYAQTDQVNKAVPKKKQKKKKGKKEKWIMSKEIKEQVIIWENMVLGYVVPIEDHPLTAPFCKPLDTSVKSSNTDAYTSTPFTPEKKKKLPDKPIQKQDMTFITPALMLRRRKRTRNRR